MSQPNPQNEAAVIQERAQKYPCQFCGVELLTKSARKRHNQKCDKNTAREEHKAKSAAGSRKKKKALKTANFRKERAKDFSEMYDDMPDGAFFAMAEEQGIEIEDFID